MCSPGDVAFRTCWYMQRSGLERTAEHGHRKVFARGRASESPPPCRSAGLRGSRGELLPPGALEHLALTALECRVVELSPDPPLAELPQLPEERASGASGVGGRRRSRPPEPLLDKPELAEQRRLALQLGQRELQRRVSVPVSVIRVLVEDALVRGDVAELLHPEEDRLGPGEVLV